MGKFHHATRSQGVKLAQAREETCDPDYLPRGRLSRRKPLEDEFDRDCGYAYDHELVFIRYTHTGAREYECCHCGEHQYLDDYTCNPDIHEMLEVGALELAFQPLVHKSVETLRGIAKDRHTLDDWHKRQGHKTVTKDEETDLDI